MVDDVMRMTNQTKALPKRKYYKESGCTVRARNASLLPTAAFPSVCWMFVVDLAFDWKAFIGCQHNEYTLESLLKQLEKTSARLSL